MPIRSTLWSQAVDFSFQVVGEALACDASIIPYTQKQGSTPVIGKGHDVLIYARRIPFFELQGKPFTFVNKELHLLDCHSAVSERCFTVILNHSRFLLQHYSYFPGSLPLVASKQGGSTASPDKKTPFLKKKGPFDLHPILPRLRFKGKRKEKLAR